MVGKGREQEAEADLQAFARAAAVACTPWAPKSEGRSALHCEFRRREEEVGVP